MLCFEVNLAAIEAPRRYEVSAEKRYFRRLGNTDYTYFSFQGRYLLLRTLCLPGELNA